MKILKVREWLFDRANQAVVDGARKRLIQKALAKGISVNPKTGIINIKYSEDIQMGISSGIIDIG